MFRRIIIAVSVLLLATFCLAQATKRLILKDGSYQSVTKYEVKGDRVRYLSAERFEWEEMPMNLIDWDATRKYEEDLAKGVSHSAEQVDKELEEEKELELAKTPEVAPNLRLPMQGGVFVMDTYQGQLQLVEMSQATSELNKDYKGNIIRATINPFAGNKQKIEVPGAHATIQVHVPRPSVYFNVEDQTEPDKDKQPTTGDPDKTNDMTLIPPKAQDRFRFVRMEGKKDSRILGSVKVSFTGKTSQQQVFIPTKGELLGGGWVKITPEQDLAPGEYAIAEMLGEKEMNLYVWDFGMNPAAPENASAWKPEKNAKASEPAEPPKLGGRPKPQ
jgi:hypothetical protein